MKNTKDLPANGSPRWSWGSFLRRWRHGVWQNLYYNLALITIAGVASMIIMVQRENAVGSAMMTEYLHSLMFAKEHFRQWNYSSFSFEPNVSDWDQRRARLIEQHQELSLEQGARPRVMMITGSSPEECDPLILSHLLLRSAKNKLDYCRIHEMEFFYNLAEPDPDFSDWWVKLPVIRMLMLQHPELEWIWWLDADAILTDMSFEPPFSELKDYNLVLYGDDELVYRIRDWKSVSTANFLIRNCQWSLDLLDAWGSMGTASMREESGNFESEVLVNRPSNSSGDDQSSLVALLAQDQRIPPPNQKWVPWVKLVKEVEYVMNGNWTLIGEQLEELSLDEPNRVPFVTHFTGCLPACTGEPDQLPNELLDSCKKQLDRAFDFADNQVYRQYGFQARILGRSLDPLNKSEALATDDNTENLDVEKEYSIPPRITDWDERRQVWMKENPSVKKDELFLVSGSAPKPCESKAGGRILLRAFKNRIDYARINGISKVFYNMAVIDKDLTGWWIKLPLLKMLMLNNPNVEWIWWMDSDAAFTDMAFKPPLLRYNESGYNLAMYGSDNEVFGNKKYTGINTGNVLIRNCQWSLDLLDRWASLGANDEVRAKVDVLLEELLSDRGFWKSADDQSVMVYLLIKEREKWGSQVCLETSFCMSGHWESWVPQFGDEWTSPYDKPFVTHFAGCHPCGLDAQQPCIVGMDKAYNFADNQVLQRYGLRHVHVNSSDLLRTTPLMSALKAEDDIEGKEETEGAAKDPAHTAEDKQEPGGALAETQNALDTAKEEEVATGSQKKQDSESKEFDPPSKEKEVKPDTRD